MSENPTVNDVDPIETQEWLDSLESIVEREGADRAIYILSRLQQQAGSLGIASSYGAGQISTPYVNTIPTSQQPAYPGDLDLEKKLEGWVRWNAAVTVAAANKGARLRLPLE